MNFFRSTHYIDSMNAINITEENLCIHDTLQSTIGKVIWINGQTKPDISFDECKLSSNLKNETL